mmetsp:Transcript_65069/g.76432  ORF Transcript_65069/g.76432 Transcript_65069/m.76432 type:complete len:102 (-) Transcript_65069:226-531(-)
MLSAPSQTIWMWILRYHSSVDSADVKSFVKSLDPQDQQKLALLRCSLPSQPGRAQIRTIPSAGNQTEFGVSSIVAIVVKTCSANSNGSPINSCSFSTFRSF